MKCFLYRNKLELIVSELELLDSHINDLLKVYENNQNSLSNNLDEADNQNDQELEDVIIPISVDDEYAPNENADDKIEDYTNGFNEYLNSKPKNKKFMRNFDENYNLDEPQGKLFVCQFGESNLKEQGRG